MKYLVSILILAFASRCTFSQTKLIAYKSHSGNLLYFTPNSADMLGMPYFKIDTILLTDDAVIEISSEGSNDWGGRQVDSIKHHPYLYEDKFTLTDLKRQYPQDVVFITEEAVRPSTDTVADDQANPPLGDSANSFLKTIDVEFGPLEEEELQNAQPKQKLTCKADRNEMIPIFLIILLLGATLMGIYFWNNGKKHILIE